ncbi:MAG: hypothetical protein ACRDV0_06495 [Acidimicrobiales bacterium]
MARTRAQRRRQNTLLVVALVATLLILGFARDVTRAAHSSTGARASEDRSFARLANDLVASENLFGQRLDYLLTHGAAMSRPIFAARLDQLGGDLPAWTTSAGLLRRPVVAGGLNDQLAALTEQRVDDYQVVLGNVAHALRLPWTGTPAPSATSGGAQASLLTTDHQWDALRRGLLGLPGHAALNATATPSAVVTLATTIGDLTSAPSLRLTRGVGITAVAVTPSPLPAPAGTLVEPPVARLHVGVVVTNAAYATQPVTLTVTFTSSSGAVQHQAMSTTLGPLASYAFVPRLFSVSPGERASLRAVVRGAPAGAAMTRSRVYAVEMSQSGKGVAISAVTVTPAPTSETPGAYVVPPTSSVGVRVGVTNSDTVAHSVTLTVTLSAAGVATQSQAMTISLDAGATHTFTTRRLDVRAGEHGRLRLEVSGAVALSPGSLVHTYTLTVSRSNTG